MLNLGFTPLQMIQKGLWSGLLATLIGSLAFTTLNLIFALITALSRQPDSFFSLELWLGGTVIGGFIFVGTVLFTLLPNLVGGVLMVWGINQYSYHKPVFKSQAINIGSSIGLVITAFYAGFIAIAFGPFLSSGEDFLIYVFLQSLLAASFAGGFVGYKFINPLLEEAQKLLKTAGEPDIHFTATEESLM